MTGFANVEEDFDEAVWDSGALPRGTHFMPWRIEDELTKLGANYVQAGLWKGFAIRDGNLRSPVSRTSAGARPLSSSGGGRPLRRGASMRIIAYDRFKPGVTMETIEPYLPEEVANVWRLWKAGIVRENYARRRTRCRDRLRARQRRGSQALHRRLPLTKGGFLEWFFIC